MIVVDFFFLADTCHDPDGCNHHRTALIAGNNFTF